MEFQFKEGEVLLLNKPLKWTSFQVVNKVRWLIRQELQVKKIKVGHAGTLDPLATGLLILCTGKKTKEIDNYQAQEKEYTGTLKLGVTTASYDAETEESENFPIDHISEEAIRQNCEKFIGDIEQKPPIFSAIKVGGQKLYEKARKGESVEIKSRQIKISEFEITAIEMPYVSFRVVCSKGTYIRSLAYDFGQALNSGAYLTALCRTRIGEYLLEDSISPEQFESLLEIKK